MHIADVEAGNLGATGIVGSNIPVATGAALAIKIRKDEKVVLCFFGDGAVNTGAFSESLNMALGPLPLKWGLHLSMDGDRDLPTLFLWIHHENRKNYRKGQLQKNVS